LVIAPHPDDESIGCGGTLCLHARRGDLIAAVYLTSGELGLKHLPPEQSPTHSRTRSETGFQRFLGVTRLLFCRLPDWFVGENVIQAGEKTRSSSETARNRT